MFSTYDIEKDIDVSELPVADHGDLKLSGLTPEEALIPISSAVQSALAQSEMVVLLGGDNGITRPGVHGIGLPLRDIGVITLDAHFDLRDTGGGLHNGNPIRALLEDGMPGPNVVQIGIQAFANSRAYARVAKEAGITVYSREAVSEQGVESILNESFHHLSERVRAIYVDVDLDVVDRTFAPGTPGSRPGGVTPFALREAVWLCANNPLVRVIDIVEFDPELDINRTTAMLGAACILECASGLLNR